MTCCEYRIPDLYLAPDQKLDTNNVEVAILDAYHNRSIGKYSGPLSGLVGKGTTIRLNGNNTATISFESFKNYTLFKNFIFYLI